MLRNISSALVLLLLVGLCGGSVSGQSLSLDPATPDAPPEVPDPRSLNPGWWSYLGQAGDQLDQRLEAVEQSIDAAVLSLSVADSSEAVAAAERAEREIRAYVEVVRQSASYSPPTLRTSGDFTLQEYLAIRASIRSLRAEISRETGQVDEVRELVAIEQAEVDARMTEYLQGGLDGVQKLVQGLKIMGDRASLALSRLRLDRRNSQLERHRRELEALLEQALYARGHLVPGEWDAQKAQEQEEELEAGLVEAEQAVELAKDALLDQDETAVDAALQSSHRRQRLLSAMIDVTEHRLKLDRVRAVAAWHELRSEEGDASLDQVDELILQLRADASGLDETFESWRQTEDVLALVDLVPEESRDRELRRLQERTRELGTENLRRIRELGDRAAELKELAEVLTREAAGRVGGFQGALRRVELALSEWWRTIGRLTDKTLFHLGDVPVTPTALVQFAFILVFAYLMSLLVRKGLSRIGRRRHLSDQSTLYLLGRLAHYLIIVAALLLALSTLGFDFGSVALIAGALSVGIGFGLQSIVNNFVSGLVLMFDRSLKIGDYIELDSGVRGLVREINVRSTRVNTNDNFDVLVPNSELFSSKLTNWTHRDAMARFRIPFGVAYGTDKELVRTAALEAAGKVDFTLKNMPGREPEVWMTDFGNSSLDFELLVWVSRQGVRRPNRVRNAYLWELESAFQRYGIEIPFPQRDLHLRSDFRHPQPEPEPPPMPEESEASEAGEASDDKDAER